MQIQGTIHVVRDHPLAIMEIIQAVATPITPVVQDRLIVVLQAVATPITHAVHRITIQEAVVQAIQEAHLAIIQAAVARVTRVVHRVTVQVAVVQVILEVRLVLVQAAVQVTLAVHQAQVVADLRPLIQEVDNHNT